MKRVLLFASCISMVHGQGSFDVNGDFAAGAQDGSERAFTIKNENLDDTDVFEESDLQSAFDPTQATLGDDGKVAFNLNAQRRQVGNDQGDGSGLKYKHFVPRNTGDSKLFMPQPGNVFVYDNAYLPLEDWIRKTVVAPLKKEIKQSQNAIRVLGALLGLNLKSLREVLTFDRETLALIESIKAGAIPVYIPGDLYVASNAQINTNAAPEVPSFCDAWSGVGNTDGDTRGTTDWILKEVFKFTSTGTRTNAIEIKAGGDSDTYVGGNAARWDNREAFTTERDALCQGNAGRCTNGQFVYRTPDDVANEFKNQNRQTVNEKNIRFDKVFDMGAAGGDITADDVAARFDQDTLDAMETELDACRNDIAS